MSETQDTQSSMIGRGRGGGRGKSRGRGGLGKYLRARGRGRGLGRPAEFGKRLVLEGEEHAEVGEEDEEEKEEAAERARKFSRRELGSNADRYVEPEPELNSEGEPELEPEVDLASFLEKQRLSENSEGSSTLLSTANDDDDEDVDTTLSHISSHRHVAPSRKGRVEQIEWDDKLDEMSREKAAAEATWDLKTRFRARAERMRGNMNAPSGRNRKQAASYVEAPPLPLPDGSMPQPKNPKDEMQDFLDDLLG